MSVGDLLYSDTEDALRDSVRNLFADRCPPELVARCYDSPPQQFSELWRTLAAELGVAGLLVPESLGGAGASAREAAVVMEEIGRAVAPVPFLSSAVLATVALLRAGDTETVSQLAQGAITAALAVPLSTAPGDPVVGVDIGADGLTGLVTSAAGAAEADVLVIPVTGLHGLELHTVSRGAAGLEVSPVLAFDMTRPLADLRFLGGRVVPSRAGWGCFPGSTGDRRGAAGFRTTRCGAMVFRHRAGLRQAAQAVRPRDRLLPGDQASAGRSVVGGRLGHRGGPLRRGRVRPGR